MTKNPWWDYQPSEEELKISLKQMRRAFEEYNPLEIQYIVIGQIPGFNVLNQN